MRRGIRTATLLLCGALVGCAGHRLPATTAPAASIEVAGVPFFPQNTDQCGPAALASVLVHTGVEVTAEELRGDVYVPQRRGSLQVELAAATRQRGRTAYVFRSRPQHLYELLGEGRPVLVLQDLGTSWLRRWHYAVVVGYDQGADAVVMRSGADARRLMPRREFEWRWLASDHWALLALRPGDIPAAADAAAYLRAVAAHEALGQWRAAQVGYSAASRRWPESHLPHFALGNAYLEAGLFNDAVAAYRSALDLAPANLPTLNNLAYAHAAQGNALETVDAVERALAAGATGALRADLVALRASFAPPG